jgi:hypothetical protein
MLHAPSSKQVGNQKYSSGFGEIVSFDDDAATGKQNFK